MDLIDRIKDIVSRIPKQMPHIQTEEATKNAFIMHFYKCTWLRCV